MDSMSHMSWILGLGHVTCWSISNRPCVQVGSEIPPYHALYLYMLLHFYLKTRLWVYCKQGYACKGSIAINAKNGVFLHVLTISLENHLSEDNS